MAKVFVGNNTFALQGSPDKRIMEDKDGFFWAVVVSASGSTGGVAKFYYSRDSGNTWHWSPTSELNLGQNKANPSMYVDQDGYAHLSFVQYDLDPQVIIYARGTPTKAPNNTATLQGGTSTVVSAKDLASGNYIPGWSWKTLKISPAGGRLAIDSDPIAFRNGTGWTAFLCYSIGTTGGCQVARVNISNKGVLSVGATTMGPSSGLEATQFGSLEFAHTGDGITPSATPHLFLGTGLYGASGGIRLNRAAYSGGVWTWGTPVVLATGSVPKTTLCGVWDGARYMFAWSANANSISVVEWDGVAAPVTRSPPALPGGTTQLAGLSLACDPVTDDIYLIFHDQGDGDVRYSKFTRSLLTWSAWSVLIARSPSTVDGQVSLPRHPQRNTIPYLYTIITGTNPVVYTVNSAILTTLVRTPPTPTLESPASGAKLNLALGGTFTWTYNPIAPGDAEAGYVFKRVNGGTTEYWNATTQAFQSGTVTNTTDPDNPSQVTFPASKWTNGVTYTWAIQVVSSSGSSSAFTSPRTVISAASPIVVVTDPTNVVYEESTPLVQWTYSSLDAQRDYEIRIVPEGPGISPTDPLGAVWTSGVVGSSVARSARIELPLTNNVSYRAYVRATSVAAIASDWVYSSFSIFVTPPSGPLVEVVDSIDFVSGVPRARLDLTGQSSFLTADQDGSATGWESDANVTLADQIEDTGAGLLIGFKMTSVAAGTMAARTVVGDPPPPTADEPAPLRPLSFPVQEGTAYTLMASFRAATTTRAARVSIRWYDDDDGTGTLISTTVSSQVNATNAAYAQANVTDVAPVGAVLARVVLEVLSTAAASEVFYVGYVSFHPGRVVAYQPGGFAQNETLRVERSDDGGTTFATILERIKPNLRQIAIAYDRLMPFGKDVIYRAFTDIDQGQGSTLSSGSSALATISLEAERWGIRDCDSADEAELYGYVVGHDRTDDESSSVHRPAGRFYPIVDTEGLQAATGTLTIFVKAADIEYATSVLDRTATFVLQSPVGAIIFARLIRRKYNVEAQRHRNIVVDYIEIDPTLGRQ